VAQPAGGEGDEGLVIDPGQRYRLAQARKHLSRVEGGPAVGIDALDESGPGVLLQYRAPVDSIPQPAPFCFENQSQPHLEAALCEAPLRVGTLNVPVINEARLVGPGLVFTRDDMILDTSIGRHAARFGLEVDADGAYGLSSELSALLDGTERGVATHQHTALLLSDPAIRHFGMWVLKCLPRLRLLTLLDESDVKVVVPADVPDKFLTLMEALGVGPERVLFHDPQGVSVFRRLIVPPKMYKPGSCRYGDPFEVFRTGVGPHPGVPSRLTLPGPGPRRVYVSRRGNRRRPLVNEKAVERLFIEHGFRVVEPSALSAVETLSLFRDCEHVAGPLGSGLYNILFSTKAPRALALTPPVTKFERLFLTIGHVCAAKAGTAGHVFGRMLTDERGPGREFDYSWDVDLGRVREALETLVRTTA
jgi:hypothetical protein